MAYQQVKCRGEVGLPLAVIHNVAYQQVKWHRPPHVPTSSPMGGLDKRATGIGSTKMDHWVRRSPVGAPLNPGTSSFNKKQGGRVEM